MIKLEPDPTPWDVKWRMLGFPVRVHPLFWLMALIMSYDRTTPFVFVLISVACILVSILAHEFGHALCQRHYGDRENYIVLYAMGGLAVGQREAPGVWPRIAIDLLGPLSGFVLGALAYGGMKAVEFAYIPYPGLYISYAFYVLFWINVIWGAVNLLPVFPLDGGQVLRELVQWKAPRRGDAFVFKISFYVALVMALLFLALAFSPYRSSNPTACYFPIVLFGVLAWQSYSLRRQILEYGFSNYDEDIAPNQPWEQDPDWWKKK